MEGEKERGRRSKRSTTTLVDYVRRIARRAEGTARRFRLHALLFGAVNVFLVLINIVTGMSFPWFLFPLGGWSILLLDHYAICRQHARQSAETAELVELSPYQTEGLRRLHRQRTAFSLTLVSAASSALFLAMTNLIVSPHFPWALITAGGLGLGALGHYVGYASAKPRLIERIGARLPAEVRLPRLLARAIGGRTVAKRSVVPAELRRAMELKARIEARLKGIGSVHGSLEAEIGPLLERYVSQIAALVDGRDEIAGLVSRESFDQIAAERSRLVSLEESARTQELAGEYRRAVGQLDSRSSALQRLRDQSEVAALRIGSALHSLEQLEIEVVRLRTTSDVDGSAASQLVERKIEELSAYITDFDEGRRGLESS